MEPHYVFDRVVAALGFKNGATLARQLGRERTSAGVWRKRGFPKVVHSDLMILASRLGKPLPREFYESTGIPDPGGAIQTDGSSNV